MRGVSNDGVTRASYPVLSPNSANALVFSHTLELGPLPLFANNLEALASPAITSLSSQYYNKTDTKTTPLIIRESFENMKVFVYLKYLNM